MGRVPPSNTKRAALPADAIELARQSLLLRIALRPLIVCVLLGMLMVWIPGFTEVPVFGCLMALVMLGALLGIDRLGRGNRIFLASLLFVLLVHSVFFLLFCLFGGLQGPYLAAFPVQAGIAGLVLGRRAAVLSAIASSAFVAGYFALGQLGVTLPATFPTMPVTHAVLAIIFTALLTHTLWVALGLLEQARRDREALERERLAAHRLESIGRLAGGVAHDFNNLLTVILANSDLGQVDPHNPAQVRRSIEEIQAAGHRAHTLTQQLLAFARRQVLERQALDLNQLVANLRSILGRLLRANIDLSVELAPELPLVRADPGKLEQVVMNLVLNAQEAMPLGGTLTLQTRALVLDRNACKPHAGLEPGPYVSLVVRDTGVGIAPELLDRVFDPFFTTKTEQGGTGLGLATVQGIVAQSGGAVLVRSEVGAGTTFQVYLPAQGPAAAQQATVEPAVARTVTRAALGLGRVALVADDDATVLSVTARMLETLGFQVLRAESGEQAQRLEAEREQAIDVLVTDVVMTRMGGRALAEALQARRPDLKVLFISGHSEDAVRSDGALKPGTRFASKPFTLAQLEDHLRALLAEAV